MLRTSSAVLGTVLALCQLLPAQGNDPSLRLWMRSDAGLSLDGDRVDAWTDQSAAGAVFTAAGSVRPERVTDGTNTYLRFQGGQELGASLPFTLNSATILALFRYRGLTSGNEYLYCFGSSGRSGSQMPLSRRSGTRSYHYDGSRVNLGNPIPSARWVVSTQVFGDGAANQHDLYIDGALALQSTASSDYSVDAAVSRIGDWSRCCFRFRGDLMELVVYNRVLSPMERASEEARLRARVRNAWVTTYGVGCQGSVGQPTLGAAAGQRPVLGTTFRAETANVPAGVLAVQGVGFDDIRRGNAALPIALDGVGLGPNCFLYIDIIDTLPLAVVGNRADWSLGIPNDVALDGAALHAQTVVFDAAANGPGLTLSNSMTLNLGR